MIKKFLVFMVFFASTMIISGGYLYGGYTFLGDYQAPYVVSGNTVTFNCGTPSVKIVMCAENIVKIWMEPTGNFECDPSYAVLKSTWPDVSFSINDTTD